MYNIHSLVTIGLIMTTNQICLSDSKFKKTINTQVNYLGTC